ncbi:MAG: GrpB family protein, partial [Candidatus Limnocylindria bacterium]
QVMDARFEYLPGSERSEPEPIELTPYDSGWPAQFEVWKKRLLAALPAAPRRFEHVGSTSVPGLPAKPVIDIQVSVDDPDDEATYVPAIESASVQLRNRDSEHRYFRPFTGLPRNVHVHVCRAGSEWERRHILFRDYLRSSPEARQEYKQAKVSAAERWSDDRLAYTEAKGETIRRLTEAANEWARNTGWRLPPELGQELPQRPGEEHGHG